jgi:hypothetical protein
MMAKIFDPLDVNGRLYRQIGKLLSQLEEAEDLGIRDRIAALVAVGRIQTIFVGLRKENQGDPDAGSAVRKYSGVFKTDHATGGRKKATGTTAPKPTPDIDPWSDDDDDPAA